MENNKKIIEFLLLGVAAVFIFGLGLYWGAIVRKGGQQPSPQNEQNIPISGSKDTAPSENNPRITVTFPTEATAIKGKISALENGKLVIETTPLNPLLGTDLNERTIFITDKTIIRKEEGKKDLAVYAREIADFNKKYAELSKQPNAEELLKDLQYPSMNTVVDIKLGAIQVGEYAVVLAEKNILNEKQFVAKEVLIQGVASR